MALLLPLAPLAPTAPKSVRCFIEPKADNRLGFTLLELIVVLSVVSILAAVALFSFREEGQNVDLAARQILQDVLATPSLAAARNLRVRMQLTAHGYSWFDQNGNAIVPTARSSASVNLGSSVTLSWSLAVLPNSYIAFDSLGTPYRQIDPLPLQTLSSQADITVTSHGQSAVVRIDPETGHATLLP